MDQVLEVFVGASPMLEDSDVSKARALLCCTCRRMKNLICHTNDAASVRMLMRLLEVARNSPTVNRSAYLTPRWPSSTCPAVAAMLQKSPAGDFYQIYFGNRDGCRVVMVVTTSAGRKGMERQLLAAVRPVKPTFRSQHIERIMGASAVRGGADIVELDWLSRLYIGPANGPLLYQHILNTGIGVMPAKHVSMF